MVRGGRRAFLGAIGSVAAPLLLGLQRRRGGAVVALYHRVSHEQDATNPPLKPDAFDAHCVALKRAYDVIPLAELFARLQGGKDVGGCAAVTFDDGFADFRTHALPILRAHGLPVTHFLVSDCVRTGKPVWTLRLKRLVGRRGLTGEEARREDRRLSAEFAALLPSDRNQRLDDAEADVGHDYPSMLSTKDIEEIGSDVEWGSHSATHALLGLQPPEVVVDELDSSRKYIGEVTGSLPRFFSYPNGSFSADTVRFVEAAGYEGAVIVGQREMTLRDAPLTVPRFDVDRHPADMLVPELTGFVEGLRKSLRRAA